ncbi:MAG: hypothetical protein SOX97_01750 [Sutterella sp.]|nr:hypothetical protein [Sutterella sp.]
MSGKFIAVCFIGGMLCSAVSEAFGIGFVIVSVVLWNLFKWMLSPGRRTDDAGAAALSAVKPAAGPSAPDGTIAFPVRNRAGRRPRAAIRKSVPKAALVLAPRSADEIVGLPSGQFVRCRREQLAYRYRSPWMLAASSRDLAVFLFGLTLWNTLRAKPAGEVERLIGRSQADGNCFWEYLADDCLQADCEACFSNLAAVLGSEALASEFVMSSGEGITRLKDESPAALVKKAAVWADDSLAGLPQEAWALPLAALGISAAADMLFWEQDGGYAVDDGMTGFEEAFLEAGASDEAGWYSDGDAGFGSSYGGAGCDTALWDGGSDYSFDGGFDADGGFGGFGGFGGDGGGFGGGDGGFGGLG